MTEPTGTPRRAAPALCMPRQSPPVNRAPYAGAMLGGAGVEADNIFDDIASAVGDIVDGIGEAVTDVVEFLEEHPAVLAPLMMLL